MVTTMKAGDLAKWVSPESDHEATQLLRLLEDVPAEGAVKVQIVASAPMPIAFLQTVTVSPKHLRPATV